MRKIQFIIVLFLIYGFSIDWDNNEHGMVCSMPDWNPARKRGIPIDTWFTLPVRFTLTNNNMNVISTIPDIP